MRIPLINWRIYSKKVCLHMGSIFVTPRWLILRPALTSYCFQTKKIFSVLEYIIINNAIAERFWKLRNLWCLFCCCSKDVQLGIRTIQTPKPAENRILHGSHTFVYCQSTCTMGGSSPSSWWDHWHPEERKSALLNTLRLPWVLA